MTREEEAILRARLQWEARGRKPKPMGARIVFMTICSDCVETVIVPWTVPPSKNVEWSVARREPDWSHAKVVLN